MTTMNDAERAGFEAWFIEETKIRYLNSVKLDRDKKGNYLYHTAHDFWRVWQARAAWQRAQSAGVPEGYVLVPTEPTPGMVTAAKCEMDKSPVYWCRYKAALRAAFEAAPAVKAERVQCEFHGDDSSACEKYSGNVPCEPAPAQPAAQQHPDGEAVDRFAVAMKAKLAKSREKGRHGWQMGSAAYLSSLLYHHMYKGDPLDVANLAMMLHQNGQAIELPQEARRDQGFNKSSEVQRLRGADGGRNE